MITSSLGFRLAISALNRICLPPVPTLIISGVAMMLFSRAKFPTNRLFQFRDTINLGIFCFTILHRCNGRILDMLGRIKVRLTSRKPNYGRPAAFMLRARSVIATVGDGTRRLSLSEMSPIGSFSICYFKFMRCFVLEDKCFSLAPVLLPANMI